jgi:hypothetical protein
MAEPRWSSEHPLERERLRLESQDPTPLSGLFLGSLVVGFVLLFVLLITYLLMLL